MPGTPCIYWPDLFDWDLIEIKDLIKIRKEAGIVSGSEWIDLTNQYSGFAGLVLNESGKEALAVSILSNYTGPGEGWSVALERKGEWTVWKKE